MLNVITTDPSPPPSWQAQLADPVTDLAELFRILELDPHQHGLAEKSLQDFPLRVPRPFLARIKKGDAQDPLLLQVLPQAAELLEVTGYVDDPLLETEHNPEAGILHKYTGRVLLLPTSACAIHCRYCFRRNFPYDDNNPGRAQWQESLDYLRRDESLTEVILSGGDPLTLSDRHLDWLLGELEAIPHLRRLRIHTRLPIMIPARINAALCARLQQTRLRTTVVIHCNHTRELDDEVAGSLQRLASAGITLLNQSVLLRGINDSLTVLQALSETLHDMHVLPYYLHLPDKCRGTSHFDVSDAFAMELHSRLHSVLPGYLVPRLVREIPGRPGKTLMGTST